MQKHVQAELPEATYDRLRRAAKNQNRSIKAVVREAVEAYLLAEQDEDPLTDLIGSVEMGGGWSTRKDWRDPFAKHESRRGSR